jgi:hypothetical protein
MLQAVHRQAGTLVGVFRGERFVDLDALNLPPP